MKSIYGQLLALLLFMSLTVLAASSQAGSNDAPPLPLGPDQWIAASADNEDDEEDEEEAVDYRDRVREIQDWMNRRDSERKGEAPSLNVAPVTPPPQAFPKYFRDKGHDENGYRRLDDGVRTRLRDAPEVGYPHPYHRHYSWTKRWHRHVHPYIHARRHHFPHGYERSYSRHSYSGGHSYGHGAVKAGSQAYRHSSHASVRREKRRDFKASVPQRKAMSQASQGKSKAGKKGRSRR